MASKNTRQENLALVTDPSTPLDTYFGAMTSLGLELAQEFAEKHVQAGDRIHIVAPVEDFEILALPIAKLLKNKGAEVNRSCVWPSFEILGSGEDAEIAPIDMSFDEKPFDGELTRLLLVTSVVATTTTLESMLTHAHPWPIIQYDGVCVLSPIVFKDAEQAFRSAIQSYYRKGLYWQSVRQDAKLSADRTLIPGIGMSPLQRIVNGGIADNRRLMPSGIRRVLKSYPRPGRTLADYPKPSLT